MVAIPFSMRAVRAPLGQRAEHRMHDDECDRRADEPRQQVPRSADQLVGAAIDGSRITEQRHALLSLHVTSMRRHLSQAVGGGAFTPNSTPPLSLIQRATSKASPVACGE